ncbi:1727_t:CDS:1 [Cetraspora pellucida]|uniref:1727_t:CDS:1 n=1 Tax=Cetraspora pellucida TaxID=1433469 RepID=A0A9N9EQV6_9GLOM|nr:1727_t:CDS:1 [Cetraspora pellucida]
MSDSGTITPSTTLKIVASHSSSPSSSLPTNFVSTILVIATLVIVLTVITVLLIFFYKRYRKRCKMSPLLQFEVMHSRVVVVDADGKSVAGVNRNNSFVSLDSSGSSGKDANSKSRMIKVLQYDDDNNNIMDGKSGTDHSKNLYYEYS